MAASGQEEAASVSGLADVSEDGVPGTRAELCGSDGDVPGIMESKPDR